MRKYDFTWLLPLTMAAVVVAMGLLLLAAGGLVSFAPPAPLVCGNAPEPASLVAPADSAVVDPILPGLDAEQAASVALGSTLFADNCAQCHSLHEVIVGPALKGITKRRSVTWLVAWVKNPSKEVASGDEYAVKLFNQYQKQQMPSFQLSDQEIKSILAYIEYYEDQPATVGVQDLVAAR